MMNDFIIRTLNYIVLMKLLAAIEAKRMTAWKSDGLLIIMVVGFETNTTLED
jgi:hypothetical protein